MKYYSKITGLISGIVFFILGAVMYTKPDAIVVFTTYIIGGLMIFLGIFKGIKNYLDVKKDNSVSSNEMVIGIVMVILGLVFIFLSGVIEALVRLVIGGWILFRGINVLVNAFYLNKKTNRFWISIVLSLLLIFGGLYTILEANLVFQTLGIVLMIYAVIEIIDYIFNPKENKVNNNKAIEDKKVIEASIVEVKEKDS